jgi:hypothetical protein
MQGKDLIESDDLSLIPEASDTGAAQAVRSRKEERMILALLEHARVDQAAAAAGVSEATMWRRLRDPNFQEALREARREAFSRAIARLQQAGSEAAATLLRIMCDNKAPGATRVRAAVSVLEMAFRGIELEDMQGRIRRLEELAQNGLLRGNNPGL